MTILPRAIAILLGAFTAVFLLPTSTSLAQRDPPAQQPPPPVAGGQLPGKAQRLPQARPAQAVFQGGVQTVQNNGESEFTDALTLPVDRQARRRLDAAEDLIKEEAWGEAARQLQLLLDNKEDVFLQVKRKDVKGAEVQHWTSVRSEANRLIGSMPENGLQFYELQYGDAAKRLLVEAKKKSDPHLLAEVSQRFFHTEAGAEATNLLGTHHLDRGENVTAALCFKRLLFGDSSDGRPLEPPARSPRRNLLSSPLFLFKAALAFQRANDVERAQQAAKLLQERLGRQGLRLGDRAVAWDDLARELRRVGSSGGLVAYDVPLFRSDVGRTAQARGSAPYLQNRLWARSTVPDNSETQKQLEKARVGRREDVLPAFFPIAANGKMIYRSYGGVHAIDLKTGELAWGSVPLPGSFDALAGGENGHKRRMALEWLGPYQQAGMPILFENSMLGTLSTDNQRVYVIDDLAIPPHTTQWNQAGWGGIQQPHFGALQQPVYQNWLVAIDLESGKLIWELGGARQTSPGRVQDPAGPRADANGLDGSYFLGPPLPLGGKLYVLTEKNAELVLVCLDPPKDDRSVPRVLWKQTLATVRDRLVMDPIRRVQAVHLAYGDGILVCPTNAGALLGIDLLTHSLVWAHSYREGTASMNVMGNQAMWGGGRRGFVNVPLVAPIWKGSTPVVQDSKVVFTAPDAQSMHCLDLRTGALLWKERGRPDDLYLAGVFQGKVVIVGKKEMRALNLADGKPLWQVTTGLPSGQGVASGRDYFLPLRKGVVCRIDLDQGLLASQSPALKDETPGNLICYDGAVLSQSENEVTGYPQVEAKIAKVDQALQKDPKDPSALLERGELRLYQGNLAGAVDDLRQALSGDPPPAQLKKTRDRLYETLTALLQRDWEAAQKYLNDYRALCDIPVPENATKEERERLVEEQRRRRENYHYLLARGREQEGKIVEAFHAYLDYSAASGKELVKVLGEADVKVRADIWVQGRISSLIARSTPEQRKPLEDEIARRWKEIRGKDVEDVHRFVAAFGNLFAVGREARLELAERLIDTNNTMEAELHLMQLRSQADEPALVPRATEALARLMTRKGLLEDAVHYYRLLQRDFAKVVLHDGKTGAALWQELATDKRFLPYLDPPPPPLEEKRWRFKSLPGDQLRMQRLPVALEPHGELLPFFEQYRLALLRVNLNSSLQLTLSDRESGEELWGHPIPQSGLAPMLAMQPETRVPYHVQGHLAVIPMGQMVYAFDLADRKELWKRSLLGTSDLANASLLQMDNEGNLDLLNNNQRTIERIGHVGPVTAAYVCLKTRQGLVALDPVRGTELWTNNDVPRRAHVFGDDQMIYVLELRDDGTPLAGRAYRGEDGSAVKVPDFAGIYQKRIRVLGGRLLTSEQEPNGNLVLRLYSIRTGKDLWKRSFPANSVVLKSEDAELAGAVEPDGKVTVVDLSTLREVLRTEVLADHVKKVNDGHVLQDRGDYYLILNRPPEAPAGGLPGVQAGPAQNTFGLRCMPVNGWVYAFRRDTGEIHWRPWDPVLNQMLLLEQFQDSPVLLFTAKYNRVMNNQQPNIQFVPMVSTRAFIKATGKLLYDNETNNYQNQGFFFGVQINRREGRFDLIGTGQTLRFYVDDGASANATRP
jgi:outer membrane protein assembly factor BamB/tetratricopeptide (TPR) repeat protein